MKRGRLFPVDAAAVMFKADAPRTVSVAKRVATQVTRTLQCLDRLRPDWVGHILRRDEKIHVGTVAGRPYEMCTVESAVEVEFHVEIPAGFDNNNANTLFGFDERCRTFNQKPYSRFTIRFLCWPSLPGVDLEAMYRSMCAHVNELASVFGPYPHFGLDYDDVQHEEDTLEDALDYFVQQVQEEKSKRIEIVYWLND